MEVHLLAPAQLASISSSEFPTRSLRAFSSIALLVLKLTCPPTFRVGNLRFQLPQSIASYSGTYDASKFGQSCPQHGGGLPSLGGLAAEAADWLSGSIFNPDNAASQAEDCQLARQYFIARD